MTRIRSSPPRATFPLWSARRSTASASRIRWRRSCARSILERRISSRHSSFRNYRFGFFAGRVAQHHAGSDPDPVARRPAQAQHPPRSGGLAALLKDVQEIYHLRRMLEFPACWRPKPTFGSSARNCATRSRGTSVRCATGTGRARSGHDLHFHSLLIRFHHNRRLESFYQQVIGELRVGMVLVDRSHDNPGALIPVHRKMYQLLAAGKLKQCAAVLAQHLDDSESRLTRVMNGHEAERKIQRQLQ